MVDEGDFMQLEVAEPADETAIKPECLGNLFPDLTQLEYNIPCRGKAFNARITSHGIGVQHREILVDAQEWDHCQRCPYFRSCYDMSMAKLALGEAIKSL